MLDVDGGPVRIDQPGQPVDRRERPFDLDAMLAGGGTRLVVGLETALGLDDPRLEELLALVEAGVADLELAPARGQHRGTGFEPGAGFAARLGGLGLGLLVSVERGSTDSSSATRARSRSMCSPSSTTVRSTPSSSAWNSRRWPRARARLSEAAVKLASFWSSSRPSSASRRWAASWASRAAASSASAVAERFARPRGCAPVRR